MFFSWLLLFLQYEKCNVVEKLWCNQQTRWLDGQTGFKYYMTRVTSSNLATSLATVERDWWKELDGDPVIQQLMDREEKPRWLKVKLPNSCNKVADLIPEGLSVWELACPSFSCIFPPSKDVHSHLKLNSNIYHLDHEGD